MKDKGWTCTWIWRWQKSFNRKNLARVYCPTSCWFRSCVWGVVRHTHSYPHAALACVKLRVETEETQANVDCVW